ncbi:hypothetical protein C8R44DRAFT_973919 [Mycena epipterygia]|nr:hypothetical protein C8R44DRAFT_973919 [Mycena epipterygia]
MRVTGDPGCFLHPSCPFDLSELKILSIHDQRGISRLLQVQTALRTIEVLDFVANSIEPIIDLSSLPNPTLLRIDISPGQAGTLTSGALATISHTNRIRKIIICSTSLTDEWVHDWRQFDRILATLSCPSCRVRDAERGVRSSLTVLVLHEQEKYASAYLPG